MSETAELSDVRVHLYDAHQIAWSVALPLSGAKALRYSVTMELTLPVDAMKGSTPWDRLVLSAHVRTFKTGAGSTPASIEEVRREALSVASALSRAGEAFESLCRLTADGPEASFTGAFASIEEAITLGRIERARLTRTMPGESEELQGERMLADEFLSTRVLALLADVERALDPSGEASRAPHTKRSKIDRKIEKILSEELRARERLNYLRADAGDAEDVELYLDRVEQLKRHFQDVNTLDTTIYRVEDRVRHVIGAIVALVASTFAFAAQVFLIKRQTVASVGSGVALVGISLGIVYALKDRLKEVGKQWLSGRVHRYYAQRVARFSATGTDGKARVLVSARETFGQESRTTKNERREIAPSTPAHAESLLRYKQLGVVSPRSGDDRGGASDSIVLSFRFDLAPMLDALDDAVKLVPTVEGASKRFRHARRSYRSRLRVHLEYEGVTQERVVVVVFNRRGLVRLERETPPLRVPLDDDGPTLMTRPSDLPELAKPASAEPLDDVRVLEDGPTLVALPGRAMARVKRPSERPPPES